MKKLNTNAWAVITTALLIVIIILSLSDRLQAQTKNCMDVSHTYTQTIESNGTWTAENGTVSLCLENGKMLLFWDGDMPTYTEWLLTTPDGEPALTMSGSWSGTDELTGRTWTVSISGNHVSFYSFA